MVVDWAGACERGEGCLASHPAGVAARDEQLGAADGSYAALLEPIGRHFGQQLGECSLGLGHLLRESLGTPAAGAGRRSRALAAPAADRCLGESFPGERSQALAHVLGSGDHERAQLVEGGVSRLHGTAPLEREQAQILASTTAAGKAQALAAEQPPGGQSRVELVRHPQK
jgi:hypothetical protein